MDLNFNSNEDEYGIKKKDINKKKESKWDKKEKGYTIFDAENSDEELVNAEKARKKRSKPNFRFAKKEKQIKEEKKERSAEKEQKSRETKKLVPLKQSEMEPVFGVPLDVACERRKSADGIQLPTVVRECIDYIEEYGLTCEGIYRVSGVKSKVQSLKEAYNRAPSVYLLDHEPNVVASLLKLYVRELPEPVLTTTLTPVFEQASATGSVKEKLEQFQNLIAQLPNSHKLLLSWMIVHMSHVIDQQAKNKMNMQNVAIVLSPTMKISHRVLAVLFQNVKILFQNVQIIKYQAPLKPVTSRWSLDMPESPTALVEELSKQEQLLNRLHEQVRRAKDRDKEEQLWEVQRIVTQLKRKMKTIKKVQDLTASKDTPYPVLAVPETIVEQIVEEKEQMGSKEEIAINIQTQNKDSDDINYDTTLPAIEPDNNTTVNNELEQSQINELLDEVLNLSRENETASELVPELGGVNDYNVTECQEEKLVHNVEYNPLPIIANDFEKIPCNDTHAEFLDTSNVSSINDTLPTSSHVSNSDKCNHPVIAAEDTKMSIKCEKHLVLDSCESILSNNEPVLHLSTKTANLECNHKIINSDVMSDSQSTQVASQHETPLSDTDHHINKWPDDNFTPTKTSFTESPSIDDNDDTEGNFDALEEQYLILLLEEEELLADKSELLKKIEAERHEIERLKLEISEEELVRAEFSDNEISTSDNSSIDEDDDEEELRDMLEQLLVENRRLEKQNEDLGESIHLECHICLDIKVQIRLIQQKHHELITNHNDMYGDCEPLLL